MPYTHFRYIAYEVPTATRPIAGGNVVSGYDAGQAYQAIGRLPVPNNTPNDASKRLKRFAGVVNYAANRLRTLGDNANTLKIFMAPEFYFRPPASLGAGYVHDTSPGGDAMAIIRALDAMFVHNDFQHWLFVPGTIIWNTRHDPVRPALYRNTLIHARGGRQNAAYFIEKNLPSRIDGLPLTGIPGRDVSYKLFHESWDNRKQRVFLLDGIPMGLEVCLDHLDSPSCRVLKHVLDEWLGKEGNTQNVSLHLLSAGGMSIQPRSVSARVNGYILRNDGIANPGARSELRQVQQYTAPDPLLGQPFNTSPSNLNGTATLRAAVAPESTAVLPVGPLTVPSKGPHFRTFPQRVVFYPPQALP